MPDPLPHQKSSLLASFPLLTLVLLAYNAIIFSGHSLAALPGDVLARFKLISGAEWALGTGDLLLGCGLLLLFIEIVKSTRGGRQNMIEQMLSMLLFIVFLVEFLIVPGAGTSTFLLLGIMSLMDVLGGYAISIAVARKEMNITG